MPQAMASLSPFIFSAPTPETSVDSAGSPSPKRRTRMFWTDEKMSLIWPWIESECHAGQIHHITMRLCRKVVKDLFQGDDDMANSLRVKFYNMRKTFRDTVSFEQRLEREGRLDKRRSDIIRRRCSYYEQCNKVFGTQNRLNKGEAGDEDEEDEDDDEDEDNENIEFDEGSSPKMETAFITPNTTTVDLTCSTHSIPQAHTKKNQIRRSKPPSEESEHKVCKHKSKMSIQVARYAAKKERSSAIRAEFEALRASHEASKMESAARVAAIEKDRDLLSLRRMELEIELSRVKHEQA